MPRSNSYSAACYFFLFFASFALANGETPREISVTFTEGLGSWGGERTSDGTVYFSENQIVGGMEGYVLVGPESSFEHHALLVFKSHIRENRWYRIWVAKGLAGVEEVKHIDAYLEGNVSGEVQVSFQFSQVTFMREHTSHSECLKAIEAMDLSNVGPIPPAQ